MLADRWLSIFLFSCLTLLLLVGCFPAKTKGVLESYDYLSSWIQAAGSLLAVYATYYIFKKGVERDLKKEEIQRRALQIQGEVYLLNNQELRIFFKRINYFSERYLKVINKLEKCIFLSTEFMSWNTTILNKEDFDVLLNAYGEDIIDLQKSLIRISMLSGYFHETIADIADAEDKNNDKFEIKKLQNNMTVKIEQVDRDVLLIKNICAKLYDVYSLKC